jgi:hypothetical protein
MAVWLLAVAIPSLGLVTLVMRRIALSPGALAVRRVLGTVLMIIGLGLLSYGVIVAPNPVAPMAALLGSLALGLLSGLWFLSADHMPAQR